MTTVSTTTTTPAGASTDWAAVSAELERLLKLRAMPFGMKRFASVAEMEAIPRIRRPKAIHTAD